MKKKCSAVLLVLTIGVFGLFAVDISTKTDQEFPKIKLTGFARVRYTVDWTPGKSDGFSIAQCRFGVTGAINKDFSYTFSMETTNTDQENRKLVYDVYMDTSIIRNFKIRAGQFKYAFGLEQTTPEADLDWINKPEVINSLIKPTRDIGLQVARDIPIGKVASTLMLALVNGSGSNLEDENNRKAFVGRILVTPHQGLTLGGSYYSGTTGAANDRKERAGVELKWEAWRLFLKAEYILGKDKAVEKDGYYFTLGYNLLPSTVFLVRYDRFNANLDLANQDVSRLSIGINRYFGKNIIWRTNYERKMETPSVKNDLFMTQFQVKF